MSSKNDFIRGQCDNCGAPLKRSNTIGKYVCHYCGAEYYTERFNEAVWVSDEEEVAPELPSSNFDFEYSPSKSTSPLKVFLLLFIALCIIACFVFLIISSFSKTIDLNSPNSSQSLSNKVQVSTPSMLSKLPSAVKAGNSIAYEGWEISIDPNLDLNNNNISASLSIQNWKDNKQILRYQMKNLILYDDLGNKYPISHGSCPIDSQYLDKQISFDPFQKVIMKSSSSWCNQSNSIPFFSGIIPTEAKHLYLYFEMFGVFEKITFIIDL